MHLRDALQELERLQQLLIIPSPYFGPVLQQIAGTDTLPVCFTLRDGQPLTLAHATLRIETAFFRLEQFVYPFMTLRLLRPTVAARDVVALEKTEGFAVVDTRALAGVQLMDVRLMKSYFTESKW